MVDVESLGRRTNVLKNWVDQSRGQVNAPSMLNGRTGNEGHGDGVGASSDAPCARRNVDGLGNYSGAVDSGSDQARKARGVAERDNMRCELST